MSNVATQFKKGQSGNERGRPKREWTWDGLLEEAMEEQDETGESYKKIVVRKFRTLCAKGDMIAIKELFNRMDGMPKQTLDAIFKNIDSELNKLETDYDKLTREIKEQTVEDDTPLQDKG